MEPLSMIGLGISLFSQLFGAKQQSSAAKSAADTQAQSAREALALQERMYEQTRADLAPYRDVGGQAMVNLGNVMGLPSGPAAGYGGTVPLASTLRPSLSPPTQGDMSGAGWPPTRVNPYTGEAQAGEIPAGAAYEPRMRADQSGYVPATAGAKWYPGPSSGGGQVTGGYSVTMRAPDGSVQDVPSQLVSHYQSKGATIVRA